jgi:hypothetical protein
MTGCEVEKQGEEPGKDIRFIDLKNITGKWLSS